MCSLHNHYLQLTMPHCHNHHSEVKGLQQLMCHVEHHAEHYAWQCAQLNSAVICRTCNNMLSTPKCLGKGSDTKGSTITSKGPTPTISSTVVLAEILRNGRAWLLIIILIWSFLLEALCNCVLNQLLERVWQIQNKNSGKSNLENALQRTDNTVARELTILWRS